MRILILSDSHSSYLDIPFNNYDFVIHCGDYGNNYEYLKENNVLFVRGNCDYEGAKQIITEIKNKKILITHGDLYNVKYHYNSLVYKALESKCDIVFFGHTHRADMFIEDNIIFINPGSYQYLDYVEIIDDNIIFYKDGKKYKNFEYRW